MHPGRRRASGAGYNGMNPKAKLKGHHMLEGINKLMMFGLGALNMTRERAEELFEECVRRGQAQQSQRDSFVRDVIDASNRTKQDIEDLVNRQVQQVISKLHLATREDLARVEAKLDQLLAREK